MNSIQRPTELIGNLNRFGNNEVGLTHPTNGSYIKIADNGDIYLMSGSNMGVILNFARQSLTFVGETVKFITNENNGLLWNNLAFNSKATKYSEPTFVIPKNQTSSIYDDIDMFVD